MSQEDIVAARTEQMEPVESILSDGFALGHPRRFERALKTKRFSAMEAQVSELLICHGEGATGNYVRLARGAAAYWRRMSAVARAERHAP